MLDANIYNVVRKKDKLCQEMTHVFLMYTDWVHNEKLTCQQFIGQKVCKLLRPNYITWMTNPAASSEGAWYQLKLV